MKAQHIARMGFIDANLKTNAIFLSGEAYRLHGLELQTPLLTPELVSQAVYPEDRAYVQENLGLAIQGVREYNIDHRVIHPDGTVLWVHAQAELTYDANGHPETLLGTVIDITERKKAEAELKNRMDELDKFNKLMVGRENKMADLKKEINTLLEQFGQPKKYKDIDF